MRLAASAGKISSVLAPLGAQRALPVDVRLDAVAVADMHRGGARQALGRALQRRHAPFLHRVHVDVERGLVELDHIDAVGLQCPRLLVQQRGERHRQRRAVTVVRIGDRIDNRHRPRQRELQLSRGMFARLPGLGGVHAVAQPQRAGDCRHHRLVAVVADAHFDAPAEVDPFDILQEAVHEMLPRLLAVGDDVDAGVLLQLDRQQRRVALRCGECVARQLPRRPQHVRLGEPGGFRQTAGDRGFEHALLRDVRETLQVSRTAAGAPCARPGMRARGSWWWRRRWCGAGACGSLFQRADPGPMAEC